MGELGGAPRFQKAVREGSITLKDATCPAIHAALQAGEKGIPFMPLRGIIGSDLLRHRDDWTVIDNPFAENDPVVVLPAIRPDITLLHATLADRDGNVWVGRDREMMMMAHAARQTLVTVERIQEESLLAREEWAAATLPALYVDAVAEAPKGAWPLGLHGHYAADMDHLRTYMQMARSDEGFAEYLAAHVYDRVVAAE
jgi:glutaconate CoA-transferase subunit A